MKILITERQFKSIITNILSEQKGEEVYNKYYSDIDKNKAIELLKLDNKSKVNGNDIIHIGLGAKILFEIQRNGDIREEDYPKAELYISLINKHNIKYDKFGIKTLPDLYRLVKKYMLDVNAPLDLILEELPSNEYDKVYEDSKWVIFIPKTEKASCWLGVNTQWCTTYGKYSLNKEFKNRDENKFEEYNREGPLYIIINKNNENEKYQFHFQNGEFMDNENDEIKLKEFYTENEGIKSFFKKIGNEKLLNYKGGNLILSNYYLDIDVLPEHITEVDGYLYLQNTPITSLGNLEHVGGSLFLLNTPIQSLGNLKYVGESLFLQNTQIESLGNLEKVGGSLDLSNTKIKSLGNLEHVGGSLFLLNTPITSLGNLEKVGGSLDLRGTQIQSLGNLKYVGWSLDLSNTKIKSLGNLKKVGGSLDLSNSPITSLGNLKEVRGHLDLEKTPITSLGNLKYVGESLFLRNTPIESLGNLKEVGGSLYLGKTPIQSLGKLKYVLGNLYLQNTPLVEKYSIEQLEEMYPQFKGKFII